MTATGMRPREQTSRTRSVWTSARAPVEQVPRWARTAAHVVPLLVLPSSVWRIAVGTFHAPIARGDLDVGNTPSGVSGLPIELYVIVLSIVSELLAFTAIGLVAKWGEVFPRWIPVLRGRRVPPLLAIVPASLGATILTLLWTWMAIAMTMGLRIDGGPASSTAPISLDDWQGILATVAYAPLLLWGPLLGALTIGYWKRRRET